MKRVILAAAAAMLASSASASTPISLSDDGTIARVKYSDLDLHSSTDRSKLTGRIRTAAEMLCLDANNVNPLAVSPPSDECYRAAVASGVAQMNEIAAR